MLVFFLSFSWFFLFFNFIPYCFYLILFLYHIWFLFFCIIFFIHFIFQFYPSCFILFNFYTRFSHRVFYCYFFLSTIFLHDIFGFTFYMETQFHDLDHKLRWLAWFDSLFGFVFRIIFFKFHSSIVIEPSTS